MPAWRTQRQMKHRGFSAVDLLAAEHGVDRTVFWRSDDQSKTEPSYCGQWDLIIWKQKQVLVPIHDREVWSKLDSGTEVELTVPASVAYGTSPASRWSVFSRKN
jgi:hypothetical protein